ncbi:hypothetical protein AVEN_26704-1 [Araneus ventricosus]|uniref:Uncharacterized protein n=1 Tax=Araneus ventricosus TaxID=182803 RepID=A0A4Y2Q155_ARAVE|nr:hypothetical protein AVEN_26704-1 [Araneus ventricosus]
MLRRRKNCAIPLGPITFATPLSQEIHQRFVSDIASYSVADFDHMRPQAQNCFEALTLPNVVNSQSAQHCDVCRIDFEAPSESLEKRRPPLAPVRKTATGPISHCIHHAAYDLEFCYSRSCVVLLLRIFIGNSPAGRRAFLRDTCVVHRITYLHRSFINLSAIFIYKIFVYY